jgi:hypothetical protein
LRNTGECVADTCTGVCATEVESATCTMYGELPNRDGGSGQGGNGGAGSGGRRPLPEVDSGLGGDPDPEPGEGVEGSGCFSTADCMEDLACVDNIFNTGVCARPCESAEDCGTERCISYTGQAAAAHCVNVIRTEYEICGVGDTSICSTDLGLSCLYLPDLPIGICTRLCTAAGGEDDAGVPVDQCSADQSCIPDIVESTDGLDDGVCGDFVERGVECGILNGQFCQDGDVCALEDPLDEESDLRCFQDCSEIGAECDEGTCTDYRGEFAYCVP